MGYAPPPLRLLVVPKNVRQALALNEEHWRSEMRHRHSRLASRRRRAHAACLRLIHALEVLDGRLPDPWAEREAERVRPPAKPDDAARSVMPPVRW